MKDDFSKFSLIKNAWGAANIGSSPIAYNLVEVWCNWLAQR